MASQVILKKSSVAARVPVAGDLAFGELALNYADGLLYYKKSDGTTIGFFGGVGSGTVTSVAALTLGTTGTDVTSTVVNSTTTPVITLNIPTASATNRGALSSADWATFNGKQAAGTYATGTGTASGTNTGDETTATIKTKLSISTLSGSNTGDQTIPTTLPNANAVTFTTSGGAAAGSTYTGAAVLTVDYSTVGAAASGHTHSYQAADGDLLAIGGLTGTTGLLKKTAVDTWTLDTAAYTTNLGTVTGVTATAPVISSGGTAPVLSMAAATTSVPGYLTAADWNIFNGKQAALGFTPYNSTNPSGYLANGTGTLSPGNVLEAGRYIDFHGGTGAATDYDVRLDCGPGTGTAGAGTLTIIGILNATNFSGSHSGISSGTNTGDQINISGNAASATRSIIQDTRAAQITPGGYADNAATYEFTDKITGATDWHSALTMRGWNSAYATWQIVGPSSTTAHENWYLRSGLNTTWNTTRAILHSGNYNSYSPTLTGGSASGTWGISVTGTAGSISGYNNPTTAVVANTIAYRDGAGDISAREFVMSSAVHDDATPSSIVGVFPTTNQLVKFSAAKTAAFLSGQTMNIAGNAATVSGLKIIGTIGVQAVAGSNVSCTTAQFVAWYQANFNFIAYTSTTAKCSWDYAGNNDISDTSIGACEMAGCVIETFSDGTQYTLRITRPVTGAGSFQTLVYNNQGDGYTPSWRTDISSANFNNYSPTLTGGSASGTWGINVTGTAGSTNQTAFSDLSITGAANKYLYINPGNGYEAMVRYNGGSGSSWYVGKRVSSQSAGIGTESFHIYSEAAGKTVVGIDTAGNIITSGAIGRTSHAAGFLQGTYNNVGDNSFKSNPIYTIGSNYNPSDTAIGNMYGVGYSHSQFFGSAAGNDWGLYVVAAGSYSAIFTGTGAWLKNPVLSIAGNTALHAGNYTSYSPTLTGGSASGTWGISITGNAGTAGTLQTARSINGTSFNGSTDIGITEWYHSNRDFTNGTLITTSINYAVTYGDPFVLQIEGNSYSSGMPFDIKLQGYIYSDTIINISGFTIGQSFPIIAMNIGGNLCFWFARQGYWQGFNVHAYTAFGPRATNRVTGITDVVNPNGAKQVTFTPTQVLRSDNYNSYSPTLTGGGASGTWGINVTGSSGSTSGNAATASRANGNFYMDQNYGNQLVGTYNAGLFQGIFAMGDAYKLTAGGGISNLYGMCWSHPNAGGIAGNLDSHGMIVAINGGFASCMSYSIKASGNVTAYSDERLKTNWKKLPDNFVERLSKVKHGIYDRIDGEKLTQVGVSAQSLQEFLPEAITIASDEMQTLSVNYGGAALASAVELAKEVVSLNARIARLEALVSKLIEG